MTNEVVCSQQAHVGIVTLNRPQALNALSLSMVRELYQQLFAWQSDPAIHAVVICSADERAFCAGGDVRWLYDAGKRHDPELMAFFTEEYRLNRLIHHYSKPYIALMNGLTMGGGVGVSMHGSHPVASERFVFAMPETSIGFFPDIGASYLLSRCPGAVGIYLGLTGNRLNASEAKALQLVQHVVLFREFDAVVAALVDLDLSEAAFERVTACLSRFSERPNPAPIAWQPWADACFGYSEVELIMKALQQVDAPWFQEVLQTLQSKSPLSLKVTLAQLLRAKQRTFDACLDMDLVLVQHVIRHPDFYEGVRALLIDKDKLPHWNPARLEAISTSMVERYFS